MMAKILITAGWPVLFANLVQMLLGSGWVQIVTWFWQSFDIGKGTFTSSINYMLRLLILRYMKQNGCGLVLLSMLSAAGKQS